jgi:Tol biopolymer transport system component
MKKFLIIALSFLCLRTFAQEVPPESEFVTIETAHFFVISDKKQENIGQFVAKKLELAYKALDPYFAQKPKKTTVIVNDKTDIANGYATRIPYPHIMIYPVLPTATESLADYGDWAFELLAHEYTHILTFEGARGFVRYLRPIFGSVITPNALMPRWWKEGVAVQMETQLSTGGRLRSSYQDAILRSFVLVDSLKAFKIYEINEFLPSWPEGQRPYMFGALMWSQMVHEGGGKVIKTLHDKQAGRVPFFINSPFEELLGMSYENFFEDTLYVIEELALKQIDIIKQVPETTNVPIGIKAQYSTSPATSPDGKYLAAISVSIDDERTVQLFEKNSKGNFILLDASQIEDSKVVDDIYHETDDENVNDGPPGGSVQKVSWFPDSIRLLYDKVDAVNPSQSYSDLYIYDIKNKTTQKLTTGLRAREGSVSDDSTEVVFVKLGAFSTALGVLDLKTNQSSILWEANLQDRISSPLFLSAENILFSLRKTTGEENLWVFNRTTKSLKSFLPQYPLARFPYKQGNTLYFTSTKNGISNIFSYDLNAKSETSVSPLTHTYTAFQSFAIDPSTKDIYATKITHKGPQIHFLSLNDYEKTPENLPSIGSLLGSRYPAPKKVANSNQQVEDFPTKNYSPWSYLWPQYWIPFLTTSSTDNRFLLQAQTGGHDPLKRHNYDLLINYDSATQKTSVEGTYLNRSYNWGWGGTYNQNTTYFVTSNNRATYTTKSVFTLPNIWAMNEDSVLQLSIKDITAQTSTSEYLRKGIGLLYIYKNFSQALALVSPKEGSSIYVGVNQYLKNDQAIEQTQYLLGSNVYFSKYLPENHAFQAKFDLLYSPNKISPIVGASTSSVLLQQDPYTPSYLMRGYNTGHFIGETLINPKFEYRFPMREINKGHSTDPFYLRRLHGALIADGIFLEGRAYKTLESKFVPVSTNQNFWNLGVEFRFDLNLAYQLPLTTIIGIYNPLGGSFSGTSSVSTSFQISSIF